MALSEFRYNKKRKHYSYIFGQKGNKRKNVLLTSKQKRKKKKKGKYKYYENVKLHEHPNPNKKGELQYVIPKIEYDDISSFDEVKSSWKFHLYDRRKIKRIKKNKWK